MHKKIPHRKTLQGTNKPRYHPNSYIKQTIRLFPVPVTHNCTCTFYRHFTDITCHSVFSYHSAQPSSRKQNFKKAAPVGNSIS